MQFITLALAGLAAVFSSVNAEGQGEATYYDATVGLGSCGWSPPYWNGHMGTALSISNWDNKAHCGQCVAVTGPNGNTITAMITDLCPGCGYNGLDLDSPAFQQIADLAAGRVGIDWHYVSC